MGGMMYPQREARKEKVRLRRPRNEHCNDLRSRRDKSRSNTSEAQNYRATVMAFNSEYDNQLKVVIFLCLIRLSHFEPSLARAVRQSGEARNAMPSALTVTPNVMVSRL